MPKDVDIPIPSKNAGLIEFLGTSPELRSELLSWAQRFANAYRFTAPVGRSATAGRLSRGAKPGLTMGDWSGANPKRPMGTVTNRVPYAVWNLTGAGPGKHTKSTGRMPWYGPFQGAYTFEKIISMIREPQ